MSAWQWVGTADVREFRGGRDALVFQRTTSKLWRWRIGQNIRTGWMLVAEGRRGYACGGDARKAAERAAKRRGWLP